MLILNFSQDFLLKNTQIELLQKENRHPKNLLNDYFFKFVPLTPKKFHSQSQMTCVYQKKILG